MFHPFLYTLIYVALVYIRPQEFVPGLQDVPILPAALGLSFITWLFRSGKSFDAPQHLFLLFFLLAMMVSVAAAGWYGGALEVLTDFYPTMMLFYLISTSTDTLDRHRKFVGTLGLLTTVLAIHGIDQSLSGIGWSGAKMVEGTRITYLGIFNDPNDLALAFVIAVPMLCYAFSEVKQLFFKVFWLACLAAMVYGMYLTNSRGGMLGLIFITGLYIYRTHGMFKALLVAPVGLVPLLLAPSRLEELDASEQSATLRIDAWYEGVQMLTENPLFGVGKGNFLEHHELTAHNSFVLIFAELGLFGYFFWLAFVGLSLYMVYRIQHIQAPVQKASEQDDGAGWDAYRKIANTYLYSMLGFFAAAFFLSRSYNVLLFILCALCVALYQCVRRAWTDFSAIPPKQIVVKTLMFEFVSIIFMYAVVKTLL